MQRGSCMPDDRLQRLVQTPIGTSVKTRQECKSVPAGNWPQNVTCSRKRGPFPQKSDCELDLSADSVVHARENRLTLVRSVPKLQSFEYHTSAYLGFEISAFISVL